MTGMVPQDVYELASASDPRVAPDGSTVAVVATTVDRDANDYRSAIWLVPADGSQSPRRFTSGAKHDSSPRWSPDGGALAFTSDRDAGTKQLYVIPASGGEARRLTDLDEGIDEFEWAADGGALVFSCRVRHEDYGETDDKKRNPRRITRLWYKLDNVGWTADRRVHIFTVPADGSAEPAQITDGDFEDSGPAPAPDGPRIAFASARQNDWDIEPYSDIYLVDASGGNPRPLTGGEGTHDSPVWSPDGSKIACYYSPGVWDEPRHGQVAVIDVGSGERTLLTTALDRNCAPYPSIGKPVWDGDDLLFGVEDRGNTHLYCVPGDGSGKPEPVIEGELNLTGFHAAAGTIVHCATVPTMPAELFAGKTQLTDLSKDFRGGRELVEPERFPVISDDGSEVEAWILRPPDFEPSRRYPTLLNIHGGPFAQYGNRFFDESQVYAAAGYVVLLSNPRGSSGYSEAWARAIRGPVADGPGMGTVDYQDCMAVVEAAVRRFDFVDENRLGVLGGSYGGFMTTWIVGHSTRFKAACSERAVNDWGSMNGSSDLGPSFASYVGAYLFENRAAYAQISPIMSAHEITTPLLIMHSENDFRCDVEQAEQLFSILRTLKREVELVRFPAEGHELSRAGSPYHRVKRFEIILEWFNRYLSPA